MKSYNNWSELELYDNIRIDNLPNCNIISVTEWICKNNHLYGIGINDGKFCKMLVSGTTTALYVFAKDAPSLSLLYNLKFLNFEEKITKIDFKLKIEKESLLHVLIENEESEYQLYRVPTNSAGDSNQLHSLINTTALRNYIKTTASWSIELFVVFEMIKRGTPIENCHVYNIEVDSDLKINKDAKPHNFDLFAFDIETVSSYDNRLPRGDAKDDVLFSVSIVNHTAKILYSFINLPCNEIDHDTEEDIKKKKLDPASLFKDHTNGEFTRKLEVFNDEASMLKRTVNLFTNHKNPYILLSYNGKGYDMIFLFKRCAYLAIHDSLSNFWLHKGILTCGMNMIHIDLISIFRQMYPELKLTLDNVSKSCLGENVGGKVEFNAINLRFIYKQMYNNKIIPKDGYFKDYNVDLSKVMKYNDVDSILLCRLWTVLKYNDFLPQLCQSHLISIIRYSQCKMQEFINNQSIYNSMVYGNLLTLHKNSEMVVKAKQVLFTFDQSKMSAGINNESYGGGFNMRGGREVYTNCKINDIVAYYPKLKEGHNISYETVCVVDVKSLKSLRSHFKPDVLKNCRFFEFTIHKASKDELQNMIHTRDLINSISSNCDEFESVDECVKCLNDTDRVIIMYVAENGNKSVLGKLISEQNKHRDEIKLLKKSLDATIEQVEDRIFKIKNKENEGCDMDDFFDLEEEEEDVDSSKNEYIENVHLRIKVWTTEKINKCDNIDDLNSFKESLVGELSRVNSVYRNLKVVNCSYYGLLGASYGALSGRNVAAILTTFGRKYIIDMARYAYRNQNEVVLVDTDSVMTCNINNKGKDIDINAFAKNLNSKLELSCKQYQFMFVMAKKVYIAKCSGKWMSRGINKNGPEIWNVIIYNLCQKYLIDLTPVSSKDIKRVLIEDVYMYMINCAKKDKSILICSMKPNTEKMQTANTPIAKMMRCIIEEEPEHSFTSHVKYFFLLKNKPTDTVFESEHRLIETPLSCINLFKFLSKIRKPMYQILCKAVSLSNVKNHNCYASITESEFAIESLSAFMDVNEVL